MSFQNGRDLSEIKGFLFGQVLKVRFRPCLGSRGVYLVKIFIWCFHT
jgi:hypothetical protein